MERYGGHRAPPPQYAQQHDAHYDQANADEHRQAHAQFQPPPPPPPHQQQQPRQPVFDDFPLKQRRHLAPASGAHASAFGPGMTLRDDGGSGLHGAPHLNRAHSAHGRGSNCMGPGGSADAAHAYAPYGTDPSTEAAQGVQQAPTTGLRAAADHSGGGSGSSDGRFLTSYQAQTMHLDERPQRRSGKKTFAVPTSHAGTLRGGSSSAPFALGGSGSGLLPYGTTSSQRLLDTRGADVAELQYGTAKGSGHIAGYTGHVPVAGAGKGQPPPARDPMAKTLITENYVPYLG
eukprot:63035-Chlamydomonas_euryale.AAC.3